MTIQKVPAVKAINKVRNELSHGLLRHALLTLNDLADLVAEDKALLELTLDAENHLTRALRLGDSAHHIDCCKLLLCAIEDADCLRPTYGSITAGTPFEYNGTVYIKRKHGVETPYGEVCHFAADAPVNPCSFPDLATWGAVQVAPAAPQQAAPQQVKPVADWAPEKLGADYERLTCNWVQDHSRARLIAELKSGCDSKRVLDELFNRLLCISNDGNVVSVVEKAEAKRLLANLAILTIQGK